MDDARELWTWMFKERITEGHGHDRAVLDANKACEAFLEFAKDLADKEAGLE